MALLGAQFVNAVSPNPVGSLQAYAGASAPTGWLLCDGTSYTTAAYPELYSVLGYTYGGSGANFNVPDLRGRMPIGPNSDSTTANTATRSIGTKGGDTRMPSHNHDIQRSNVAASSTGTDTSTVYRTLAGTGATYTTTQSAGSGGGENMPPFLVTNYIIKAVSDAPRSGLAYGSTPPIVTALPSNPQFGDVVTYIADATNGVAWNLQYDATGTYPWKFIGGAPLVSVVAGASATASASYVALGGPTLSITLPGDYDIGASFSVAYNGSAAAGMGVQIGAGGDEDYAWGTTEAPGYNTTHNGTYRKTVSSAATLTSKVKSPQSVSIAFNERVLRATPVRVKAP